MHRLTEDFDVSAFGWDEAPEADVIVVVKHLPCLASILRAGLPIPIIFAPIDYFDSDAQIAAAAPLLRQCRRILVHGERLRGYFAPYAPVEYIDHHVRFIAPEMVDYREKGEILWVGVYTNLPPVVHWVNEHPLPAPLRVLTNVEATWGDVQPADFGFHPDLDITVEPWSEVRHRERMRTAKAALDIKGSDFRAWHKPPAKGIDYIASGVPLAMNPESSTVEHLARMGFEVAAPLDVARWLSRAYWEETRCFGHALRELLRPERVARRYAYLLWQILLEGGRAAPIQN